MNSIRPPGETDGHPEVHPNAPDRPYLRRFTLNHLGGLLLLHAMIVLRADAGQSSKVFLTRERGRTVRYEIAASEWFVKSPGRIGHFETMDAVQATSRRLAASPQAALAETISPVAYRDGQFGVPSQRRVVTSRILLKVAAGVDVGKLMEAVPGSTNLGERTWSDGFYLARVSDSSQTLAAAESIRRQPGVLAVYPQLGRSYEKEFIPDDPLFPTQWHLDATSSNGGTVGVDINVVGVWETYRGEGQIIGILDDAIQVDHPDLAAGIDFELAYDFRDDDPDPSPGDLEQDLHGTGVSGFAAARGNNQVGVTGVAFGARLAPMRLIGDADLTDETIAEAFSRGNDQIQVKNSSWGSRTTDGLDYPAEVVELALDKAVQEGRQGRGEIFVFSAGNYGNLGDNLNYNMLKSRPDVIPVGAIIEDGSPASYTTPGAPLLVVAPGGQAGQLSMHTTDLVGEYGQNAGGTDGDLPDPNYTANFSGTSASSPIVAGVVALMLQANPELGWRDVQEILIRSALKVKPSDPGWTLNGAGFHFHHYLGAGLVQAGAAVDLAKSWKRLGTYRSQNSAIRDVRLAIPDDVNQSLQQEFHFDGIPMRVEFVQVTVDITHLNRGQLLMELTSPSGMKSRLAERHTDRNDDWEFWTFGSRRHWGELSNGKWTLEIRDMVTRQTGRLNFAKVELLGTILGGAEFVGSEWIEAPGGGLRDGVISPGEIIEERVVLRNVDSAELDGVTIEWKEMDGSRGVELLESSARIGKMAPGTTGTHAIPLKYRLAADTALCGKTLEFACITTSNGVRATNHIFRRVGILPGPPVTEEHPASLGLPLTVIDRGTVIASNWVDVAESIVEDVKVWVRMDHTTVGDTQVTLIHPDGTEVMLAQNRGGNHPDMGVGDCLSGTPLVFSDSAAESIQVGEAPFAKSYQPDEPLAALRGKGVQGNWRLRVSDVYDEDNGTLLCWGLTISRRPLVAQCTVYSADPLVVESFAPTAAGGFRVVGKTDQPGRVFLEGSEDLLSWDVVAEASPAEGNFVVEDPATAGRTHRFYRLHRP